MSVAYDPSTNLYVAAWSGADYNGDNRIKMQAWDATSGERVWFASTSYVTKSHPALACNSTWVTGSYNCMLAWQTAEYTPTAQYQRINFSSSGISSYLWASPKSMGYISETAPALAATPSSSYPWVLGFQQGEAYYTIQYLSSNDTMNNVAGMRSGCLALGSFDPAIGASNGRLRMRYIAL